MHPQDGGLRHVDDGGAIEAPKDTAVRDGERAPDHVLHRQVATLSFGRVVCNGGLHVLI